MMEQSRGRVGAGGVGHAGDKKLARVKQRTAWNFGGLVRPRSISLDYSK